MARQGMTGQGNEPRDLRNPNNLNEPAEKRNPKPESELQLKRNPYQLSVFKI